MRNTIIQGDALEELRKLPDESVHCCVCSPPYWSLRDYGVKGQLGLEKTPEEYVERLVEVFREVRRVLRDDGTLWLNLGDSYAGSWGNSGRRPELDNGAGGQRLKNCDYLPRGGWDNRRERPASSYKVPGLKPKDLCGIPWKVAFALQADGWWLRSDIIEFVEFYCPHCGWTMEERIWRYSQDREIIWAKSNPMPESIRDRPTRSHEYIFLLTKSGASTYWTHRDLPGVRNQPKPDYRWFDRANNNAETTDEPSDWRTELLADGETKRWQRVNLWRGHDYFYDQDAIRELHVDPSDIHRRIRKDGKYKHNKSQRSWMEGSEERADQAVSRGRNKRDVWWIATQPFPDAHYAVYPLELIRPCILAGTSERGCCPECGAPWERAVERTGHINKREPAHQPGNIPTKVDSTGWAPTTRATKRWHPTCSCDAGEPIPCIILDPFFGAGTTGLVAKQEGRHYLGIELGSDNVELARARIKRECPMDRLL